MIKEQACEGYTTFSIPQNPPKHSVVEIIHPDGSHSGYATCVKLHNGHNGLLTAYHVVSSEGKAVHSLRNGAKIRLDAFKPFFENEFLDKSVSGASELGKCLGLLERKHGLRELACLVRSPSFRIREGSMEVQECEDNRKL